MTINVSDINLLLNIAFISRIFDSSYVLSCGHDFKFSI